MNVNHGSLLRAASAGHREARLYKAPRKPVRIKQGLCALAIGLGASLAWALAGEAQFPVGCHSSSYSDALPAETLADQQDGYRVFYLDTEMARQMLQAQGFAPESVGLQGSGMWIMVLNSEPASGSGQATGPSADDLAQSYDDSPGYDVKFWQPPEQAANKALTNSPDLNQVMEPSAAGSRRDAAEGPESGC